MGDKSRGLYNKFTVIRNDGTSEEGGKHHNCQYFVLDLTHDPYAIGALREYADCCRAEYQLLAESLYDIIVAHDWAETEQQRGPSQSLPETDTDCPCLKTDKEGHCVACGRDVLCLPDKDS